MRYPENVRDLARDLFQSGKKVKEISEILSISTSSVSLWLNQSKQIVSKKCIKCNQQFVNIHRGNRRLCYNCRPTSDAPTIDLENQTKKCSKCNIWYSFTNYCPLPGRYQSYCNTCQASYKSKAKPRIKSECVKYKGGVCEKCQQIYPDVCYDFHHRDPLQKEFTISNRKTCRFSDIIKKELDKCMILCSNCHRLVHEELRNKIL